ncbi:MAG: NAD(P)H-dependent oxidoreductase subunit E [Nitrospiraceae bacterium]|nr:NAD(P)H-dependent oxidoreductase subunit E [Nitrospiraceae bacterium]
MAEQAAQIREILAEHKSEPPNILKALLAVQARLGYVPAEAAEEMAQVLGVTAAQLAGVLSYYPDFRLRAAGRHVIRVCQGESCFANGCARVLRELQNHLGIHVGDASAAERFTIETMSCAGNCAVSPTVVIDGDVHGRVTPSQVAALLKRYP